MKKVSIYKNGQTFSTRPGGLRVGEFKLREYDEQLTWIYNRVPNTPQPSSEWLYWNRPTEGEGGVK